MKLLTWLGLREERPSLSGFLEIGEKNPCLPAKFSRTFGKRHDINIFKYFHSSRSHVSVNVAAATSSFLHTR